MVGCRERPLGPGGGPVGEFVQGLRQLRQAAGNPSYEQMARQVHYARSTLHAATQSHKLPTKGVALAYVRACGGDEQAWATRWEQARAQADLAGVAAQMPSADSGPASGRREGTWQESVRPLREGDPRQVGGFTLIGFLGAGAMGRVYLGRTPVGRCVAVKVIEDTLAGDEQFRARFRQEIAAAQRVSGRCTAAVVCADPHAERPWLATEYVPGPSLLEAVTTGGPLPVDRVVHLAAGVAQALATIHAAGVVHRDLKPGNVLLAEDGPRVIDFGIARAQGATPLTRMNLHVGTPGYMAPEQILAHTPVGPPGDVFALGALLAFAASGQPPFGTGDPAALAYRIIHEAPNLAAVPDQLRELITRCLAKDPGHRPIPEQIIAWCQQQAEAALV